MTSISESSDRQALLPFEKKSLEYLAEVVINKSLIHQAGFGSRSIPTYVGEWILSRYLDDGEFGDESRARIAQFIAKYLPAKGQKDQVKDALLKQEVVKLLDDYSVTVNLKSGQRQLRIPFLDITDASVNGSIVEQNDLLLTSGVWGVGELYYIPPDGSDRKKGEVWLRDFKPFQVGALDIEYYIECRQYFTTEEWRDLLVSSMGFNPSVHTDRQKLILLTRILPFVEPRINLVELAPKGTGKSFVYDNVSRYARVMSGGRVSPAVLFHNLATNTPGLVTRYDVVVFDEIQSIAGDTAGELIAGLKVYLESGKFSRGKTEATSEAGFVMLGNITLDEAHNPVYLEEGIFTEIPNFLRETAFIDRLHGIISGWDMPRVSRETPSQSLGLKGDFFAEVLHRLRGEVRYADYVKLNMQLHGCDDLRDRKAITRLATGYLKLLFPDLNPTFEEFREQCVKPAVELRQRVRDELHKLDPEYAKVEIMVG
ncbi:MAG: BREX system Lon protease-like protein BrxL [Chloroflexota bacterium]|nr:BREX system Lon protease-like protein BrxL [Chloroflexota bacterium]